MAYYSRKLRMPFQEVLNRVTQNLQLQGFGVITVIDVRDTFQKKLNVNFRNYRILGACNPGLAYRTVTEDIDVGLLLPCNVVVYEGDESGASTVAAIDANAMMSVVGDAPPILAVAREVNEKLIRVLENI